MNSLGGDRSGAYIWGDLRQLLTGEHADFKERRNQIFKLMCELQTRKRLHLSLQCLRTATGTLLTLLSRAAGAEVMMYSDDLIICFSVCARVTVSRHGSCCVTRGWGVLGAQLSFKKAATIVRIEGAEPWLDAYHGVGIEVRNWARYLGVQLGNLLSVSGTNDTECELSIHCSWPTPPTGLLGYHFFFGRLRVIIS